MLDNRNKNPYKITINVLYLLLIVWSEMENLQYWLDEKIES